MFVIVIIIWKVLEKSWTVEAQGEAGRVCINPGIYAVSERRAAYVDAVHEVVIVALEPCVSSCVCADRNAVYSRDSYWCSDVDVEFLNPKVQSRSRWPRNSQITSVLNGTDVDNGDNVGKGRSKALPVDCHLVRYYPASLQVQCLVQV